MSSDADKVFDLVADKLRRKKGLCPPTPEEAAEAFKKTNAIPVTEEERAAIVRAMLSGTVPVRDIVPSTLSQSPAMDQQMKLEWHSLCRNEGEGDEETERLEAEADERSWKTTLTKFDWEIEKQRQFLAGRIADDLVQRQGYSEPIDPLRVVELEQESLRAEGADFRNSFDGKLKYSPEHRRFTLLYNTKYDEGYTAGPHHPRTLFSIAHELGHYYLDTHRNYLMAGGSPHASKSEFRREHRLIEREADAFAASLLLPTHLAGPRVRRARPTLDLVEELRTEFLVSPVCATFRIVRLSDDPCAVAGLRDGKIVWMFPSDRLIEGSAYPQRGAIRSEFALEQWQGFASGGGNKATHEALASDWFGLYGRAADMKQDLCVREHYLPVRVMDTLVVLITLNYDDLFGFDERDPDEEDYSTWTKERHDSGD